MAPVCTVSEMSSCDSINDFRKEHALNTLFLPMALDQFKNDTHKICTHTKGFSHTLDTQLCTVAET
jgi:hypothetical protein